MPDVFVSYCAEDGPVAQRISEGLQAAGYSTWYYEKDSLPGTDYIESISEAITSAKAFVVIISPRSVLSSQVYRELTRASEDNIPMFPLLHTLRHEEFQERVPKWRQAMGATTSISIPSGNVDSILPRLVAGLKKQGVLPSEVEGPQPPARQSQVGVHRHKSIPLWVWGISIVILVAAAAGITLALTNPPASITPDLSTLTTTPPTTTPGEATTSASITPVVTNPISTTTTIQPLHLNVTQTQLLPLGWAKHVAWSPDGSRMVAGTYKIQFLDGDTYQELQKLESVQWSNSIAFSPDSSALAYSGTAGQPVGFIKVGTWGDLGTLPGSADCKVLDYSSDGKLLATAVGNVVKLWELSTLKELRTFPDTSGLAVVFSPDSKILAAAGGIAGQEIKLWNVETGDALPSLKGHTNWINSIDFSPDGHILASGSTDKSIRLWDMTTGRLLMVLNGHTGYINAVAFSPDGRLLASASWDFTVKLWDTATGQEVQSLTGHTNRVECVAFSPDGKRLVSGSEDGLRIWSIK